MLKKKILVVDDSEICRETARYLLESKGYEVVTLDSPFGFGSALGRERPHLALVDANMPAIQGDQLIRLAGEHELIDCPIVLHSDRPPHELQALALRAGASGFISKTSDADKLARQIEAFLTMGPAPASSRRPVLPPSSSPGSTPTPSTRFVRAEILPDADASPLSASPLSARLRARRGEGG